MVARATSRAAAPLTEEGRAAARTLLATTAAIGGMVTLIDLAVGSLPVVALPSLALVVGLIGVWLAGWTVALTRATGWAAAAVWLVLVPTAPGEAILVPLAMTAICASVAIGPGRVLAWAMADAAGRAPARIDEAGAGNGSAVSGWIEDL